VDPADPVRLQGYDAPFLSGPIDRSTPLEVPLNRSGPGWSSPTFTIARLTTAALPVAQTGERRGRFRGSAVPRKLEAETTTRTEQPTSPPRARV